MRDPRKAEMNKEVMAIYSPEASTRWAAASRFPAHAGVVGLNNRAALRHRDAPRDLAVGPDLSAKDPYSFLPCSWVCLMYLVSKMTR